jgi:class II bacteriocin class with double-glycine leader peptide
MTNTITFETIDLNQLADITGGFSWSELGRATGGGAVAGAAGGAAAGAIGGAFAGGVGAGPGALAGFVGGGVGGAITSGGYNVGQQLGWWK